VYRLNYLYTYRPFKSNETKAMYMNTQQNRTSIKVLLVSVNKSGSRSPAKARELFHETSGNHLQNSLTYIRDFLSNHANRQTECVFHGDKTQHYLHSTECTRYVWYHRLQTSLDSLVYEKSAYEIHREMEIREQAVEFPVHAGMIYEKRRQSENDTRRLFETQTCD